MRKIFKIVLVNSLALLCFSCYYDEFPKVIDIPEDQVISFSNDIIPIFEDNNCVQCHSANGESPDLTPGNEYNNLVPAYVTAGDSNGSKLYTQLNGSAIHLSVDDESLNLIEKWIDDGAENN